jgi:biotin carboxyl carrier protein
VRFEVETGRRRRTIEIRQSAGGWAVTLDGRPLFVDFVRAGDRWSLLVRKPRADDRSGPLGTDALGASHEVAIESRGQRTYVVHVDGHLVPVTVLVPGRARTRSSRSGGSASGGAADLEGPVTIVAPMPGRVVKVLVTPGAAVVARQGLVVVEAMKMENELRAPRAGTVAEIRVREGAPVDANAVLVVIT